MTGHNYCTQVLTMSLYLGPLLDFLEFCIQIGNTAHFVPVVFVPRVKSDSNRYLRINNNFPGAVKILRIYTSISILAIFISLFEFYANFKSSDSTSDTHYLLWKQAFHVFHAMITLVYLCGLLIYQDSTAEVCQTVNALRSFQLAVSRHHSGKKCIWVKLFVTSVIVTIFCVAGAPAIFIPVISLKFKENYSLLGQPSLIKGILIFLMELIWAFPLPILVPFFMTLLVLSTIVAHIQVRNLKVSANFATTFQNYERLGAQRRMDLAVQYRKLQIFMMLSNACLQKYAWTSVQFNGSMLIIFSLFSLIRFWRVLGGYTILGLVICLLSYSAFVLFIMDYASRPFSTSKRVLATWRGQWRRYPWSWRFFRSCQPIAFGVGSFHKIDRERAPFLMRYCLQRTFVLTKTTSC